MNNYGNDVDKINGSAGAEPVAHAVDSSDSTFVCGLKLLCAGAFTLATIINAYKGDIKDFIISVDNEYEETVELVSEKTAKFDEFVFGSFFENYADVKKKGYALAKKNRYIPLTSYDMDSSIEFLARDSINNYIDTMDYKIGRTSELVSSGTGNVDRVDRYFRRLSDAQVYPESQDIDEKLPLNDSDLEEDSSRPPVFAATSYAISSDKILAAN